MYIGQAIVKGDFRDPVEVWNTFLRILNRLPDTTILTTSWHPFTGGGMSGTVIFGESHAAIHTWPEHGEAYVMLASCAGDHVVTAFQQEVVKIWEVDHAR